mmetsp:Transcript_28492/g.42113  ORF Transcript_28492/g.42113 Transcript_28492/m.42113 type:complete len:398 (+) Transcript_28492:87-1280(+)
MGVSPKKSRNKDGLEKIDTMKKVCLTAGLCIVAYFLTKPVSSSDLSLSRVRKQNNVVSTDRSGEDLEFWNGPEGGEFTPKIAWLMSYPNSGTSFTMTCVEHTSDLSTASNYGDEVTAKGDYSLSIYPRHQDGPFWEGLSGKLGAVRPLPENYVLVKTHCGSRCVKCDPSEYVETYESFLDACRLSSGRVAPDRRKQEYLYPAERVKKAIHLIRNPYHNFVARFHLERKNAIAKGKEEWVRDHPSNATGFQLWCQELDENYANQEYEIFEDEMLKKLRRTPCHGEVFKYTQWHNLAFQVTEKRAIDSLVVFYGDYESKFNETVKTILDFLDLPMAETPLHFDPGHEYSEYYTEKDKKQIRQLVQELASATTWDHVERYFDEKDPFFQTHLSQSEAIKH